MEKVACRVFLSIGNSDFAIFKKTCMNVFFVSNQHQHVWHSTQHQVNFTGNIDRACNNNVPFYVPFYALCFILIATCVVRTHTTMLLVLVPEVSSK